MNRCPRNHNPVLKQQEELVARARTVSTTLYQVLLEIGFFWPRVPFQDGSSAEKNLQGHQIVYLKMSEHPTLYQSLAPPPKEAMLQSIQKVGTMCAMFGIDWKQMGELAAGLKPLFIKLHAAVLEMWNTNQGPSEYLHALVHTGLFENPLDVIRLSKQRENDAFDWPGTFRNLTEKNIHMIFQGLALKRV